MRTLGFSTLLAAALLVAPACSKKEEAAAGDKADPAKADASKTDDKSADAGKPEDAKAKADGGLATAASGTAQLAAGGFPSAINLIPDQAQFILGLSPKAITSSPMYALVAGELAADADFQSALATFKDCGLDPNKFDSVLVGVSMTEDFVAVMVGDGIGEDANATCVIKNVQKLAGDPQLAEVVTQDGKKIIQFTDGRAYLVDGRTLAIATTAWESAVTGLIDGGGTPATTGKKDLFAKVDGAASIWGVASLPPEIAGMAPMFGAPPEFSSVTGVTGSIDLSEGAAMRGLAVFSSEDKAKAVSTQMQTLFAEASKQAPPEISNVVKTVKIASSGADVTVEFSATMDDINNAKSAAGAMDL